MEMGRRRRPLLAAQHLLLLAFAACALCAAASAQEGKMVFGKVQIVIVHDEDHGRLEGNGTLVRQERQINLRLKDGELRRLLLPFDFDESKLPRTGALVMVRPQPLSRCTTEPQRSGTICAAAMMAHEASLQDVWARGQPRGMMYAKVLLVQLDVCNMGIASPNWDALEGAMWSGLASSQQYTVEGMFKACSFDMAQVTKAVGGNMLRVPVPVPCGGTTPQGQSYDSSQCPFNEWSDVANAWLRANAPQVNLDDYPFKIYIVPRGKTCAWGGMGYVGCSSGGDCRAWIQGDLWNKPVTYFHELSHNFYLNHAGKWGNKGYDDFSGAMGYCCDTRCHNAPHSYQLGWAGPVKTLSTDNWPAGQWETHTLPAAVVNPRNFIRVWPDWSPQAAKYKLYLQYRKRVGWDFEITQNGEFGDRVDVYAAAADDPQPFTSWEAGVSPGQQWQEARLGSGLVVRVPSVGDDGAVVSVCRASERAERSCSDGLDNDCDGKTDGEDPDCAGGGGGGGGGGGLFGGGGGGSPYGGGGNPYGGGGNPYGGGGNPYGGGGGGYNPFGGFGGGGGYSSGFGAGAPGGFLGR